MVTALPPKDPTLRAPARGTLAQPAPRFDAQAREWAHDGWDLPEDERLVKREISVERPRSVISWNQSPDLGFDRALNPYRGCEHGCIYCYARPSHAYLGLSPGLDFETRLIARPDAARVLERELGKTGYRVAPLALGSNTDPWQPVEQHYRITRSVLEVLRDWRHPVTITTRGAMVERDLDILSDMAVQGLAEVGVSVTTLDPALARAMEPRAPSPARRLATMRALSDAGVPVRLMMAPLIPGLSDHEAEAILTAAREAGARTAWWAFVRLPGEVAPLFRDWLERVRPGHAVKVMNRVREMRGGRDNDPEFHSRFRGQGPYADMVATRIRVACNRLGFEASLPPLDCSKFRKPPRAGDQLSLF
ncbi:MAG: PA0069 family radical SAM protein [Rhodobacter sp.]|nr:PA0069 family radical SAM protein [Paracoccaceae bacterium]MCB1408428.1 PA0069 family radical SAM protein [Paracoccaceae bacterium]MCC0080624.1 PA0069 family radical SAM protein [Rhodobacter sp.]